MSRGVEKENSDIARGVLKYRRELEQVRQVYD